MPISPAYNLATYRAQLLHMLEGQYRRGSSPSWSDGQILTYINDAIRQIYLKINWLRAAPAAPVNLVSGTARYLLPQGRQGIGVSAITLTVNGLTTPPLTQRDYSYQQTLVANSTLAQNPQPVPLSDTTISVGVPTDFYLDPSDQRYLIFIQTPNVNGTINFIFRPGQPSLTRLYDQQPITANVINNSSSIVLSGTPPISKIAAGDQFGVYFTTELDSVTPAPALPMPLEWYTIDSITTGTITLTEAYQGETNATANFITSQAPLFEMSFPGMLGLDPCDIACALAIKTQDSAASTTMYNAAMARIDMLTPNLENFDGGLPIPAKYLLNFYRR